MAKQNVEQEIKELRGQVAALSRARKQARTSEVEEPAETPKARPSKRTAKEPDLGGQFDELYRLLEEQIKDIPTITAIGIFALGILLGRLLPR
jgi:hypothetical protein